MPVLFNPIFDFHSFIFKTLGLICGVIFFISLHQFKLSDGQKEKLLYVILIAGALEACIGLIQYFSPDLRIPFVAFSTSGKIYGNFQQPNLLASFLATSLVISLFLVTGTIFKGLSRVSKTGFYLLVMTISFVLFLTGSRTGLVGLVFGSILLFISRFRLYYKAVPLYLIIWLLAAAAGLGSNFASERYFYRQGHGVFQTAEKFKKTAENLLGEGVSEARIPRYLVSYEMFRDKPLMGHGPGGFTSKYIFYRRESAGKFNDSPRFDIFTYHPHNETLFILVESGIIGGIGLLIVTAAFLVYIFRLGREKGGLYASLLLPIAFHTQLEFPLYQSIPHWALFLFLLYLPSSHFTREIHFGPKRWLRAALFAFVISLFILTNLFLLTTLRANIGLTKYYRLLMSKGESRAHLAEPALNNLYLNQFAQRMFMDISLGMALKKDDTKFMKEFVEWSQEERKMFPHFILYEGEARALFALDKRKEAYKLLKEGLSLYPENEILMYAKKKFILKEAKESILKKLNQHNIKFPK